MHLNPGQIIMREFGGKLAGAVCDVDPSAVWRWSQPKPTGTGGTDRSAVTQAAASG